MSLVHNEKTKLSATWLNGIAIAAVAVGGIAAATGTMAMGKALALFLLWIAIGFGLHMGARAVLDGLKDQS